MPEVSRLEVITTGARRRWTLEEKQRIVAESFSGRRVVSATARRHGLSTSQLFNWGRLARTGQLVGQDQGPGFVPVTVAPEDPESPGAGSNTGPLQSGVPAPSLGRMAIVLCAGRRVIVGSDVDPVALRRVLDVLERR
jgi:transposase